MRWGGVPREVFRGCEVMTIATRAFPDGCWLWMFSLIPSSSGMWKPALQLLEIMPSEGVRPDLTTYNAALDVCAKVWS